MLIKSTLDCYQDFRFHHQTPLDEPKNEKNGDGIGWWQENSMRPDMEIDANPEIRMPTNTI